MTRSAADYFEIQAVACDNMGSPYTAALCRLLGERLDDRSGFGRRLVTWPGDPLAELPALRACGALHALARSGREPALTAVYPPAPFDRERVWAAITTALARHDDELCQWLESAPQTNEVARSAIVLGGALLATKRTGLPLALIEMGASAGLNLNFDRYRYDLGGGRTWGEPASELLITSEWRGNVPPLDTALTVASRAGCDRNPLDPASSEDANRLVAYVWTDQVERLARLETALRLTAGSGIRLERADAADWVEQQMAKPAVAGICRFFFHTIVWQYLPAPTQERISTALNRAGAAATPETPLVHFAVEGDGKSPHAIMTMTIWPGRRVTSVGTANFHGRWVDWT